MTDGASGLCAAIAIGGSAGALEVVIDLVQALPADFPLPILLCLHLHPSDDGQLAHHLGERAALAVIEACDKLPVQPGRLHVAPADYHLLVERDRTLALSTDPKVHYCRPSIDVLFESAARTYSTGLLALLLSGANEDGAAGLCVVRACGGVAVVQDPATAPSPEMPRAACDAGAATLVLSREAICALVVRLHGDPSLEAAVQVLGGARP